MKRLKSIISTKTIKALFLLGFFVCSIGSYSQNIRKSDSLEKLLKTGDYDKVGELDLLEKLTRTETDLDKLYNYSLQLIIVAKDLDSTKAEYRGYLQKGNALIEKGDITKGLESYFEASKIAKDNDDLEKEEARIDIAIAGAYSTLEDTDSSFEYYREGLKILKRYQDTEEDLSSLADAQFNFGDEFLKVKNYDSAFYYTDKANKIFEQLESEIGIVFCKGNFGLIYAGKGNNEEAEKNIYDAIEVLTTYGAYSAVCEYLTAMSGVYEDIGEKEKALDYARQSLDLAKKHGLKDEIGDGYYRLYELYDKRKDSKRALEFYKNHIDYRDSVTNVAEFQRLNRLRTKDAVYESEQIAEKQKEIAKATQQVNNQQKIIIGLVGLALIIIGFLAFKFLKQSKVLEKQKGVIEFEKHRSEELLNNILPEETAQELKENGFVKAKQFENVTVLFTDFKGFTSQAELLSPEDLVKSIDYYFTKFDEITEKYGLEKIKTIGDAYMCAGGLPFPKDNHVVKVCQAALEIADFVKQTRRNIDHNLAKFDIRIGVHTGPVVAGVVGSKKFQYDIWGDTVNTASRMESSGEIGRVNISEATYKQLVQYDAFNFTARGALEAKGKGKIDMYFVD
ncbi:adenylate/guanylate cyclase domain-containing protein [Winogradskyella litorisediminis]|uniref:Adenylate/guanylate cyclase domain-containing protein n=1 Tax=Winogradskyella litorisediminis TaxID=1156618 RepID=A0ABW3N2F3_9FLAO